jgi:CubicO group peptidase (beta-lactamase class C family)
MVIVAGWAMSGCEKDRNNPTGLPVLTTLTPYAISFDTAIAGGSVSDEGSSPVTDRGIVWSMQPSPTVSLVTRTRSGAGNGAFSAVMRGLTPAARYYVRAYATNATGTAYGNEVFFTTGSDPNTAFAELRQVLQNKMLQYAIPALSVAVVRNGRLVYLDALGTSDKEAGTKASVDDRYRIASVSKPLTLIALLDLVQEGTLSLDQRVFGNQGILGNSYGIPPVGSGKEYITVRHLIEHRSGWRNVPVDPMFSAINRTQEEIITDLVMNRTLASVPGSDYAYFNTGYCILGRVIEKITGKPYETSVQDRILKPAGIQGMRIGGSTLDERFSQEVKYYQPATSPYVMNIPRLDAAGGWIASARDLARILVRVDRNPGVADIISPNLLEEHYFGFFNWYTYGSLPGTSAIMHRINHQLGFILLVNTRTEPDVNQILDDLNTSAAGRIGAIHISAWPERDFF